MLTESTFIEKMNEKDKALQHIAKYMKSGSPYTYMTVSDYQAIVPKTNVLYWVVSDEGKHGVFMNNSLVEGTDVTIRIYGVEWDGTASTSWKRTDTSAKFSAPDPYIEGASGYGSPFDDLMPWSGMVKEERTGGTMVAIPKFWYRLTQNGKGLKVQITDHDGVDGFHVSPAHMDRGDGKGERDVVYIGRYHCASDYKSKTGVKPAANITRSGARTSIHNLGSTIWQSDFAMRFTLWLLYIVEFADWNSQNKIGHGCGDDSSTGNMGYTDTMPYHTGTTQSDREDFELGTQYRNIEGLWDNVYDWCDGVYYNANGMNIILKPADFSDSANGVSVGTPVGNNPSEFSVKDISGAYPMFIPVKGNGSVTTYSCDRWTYSSSSPCLITGGNYKTISGSSFGMLCISADTATGAYAECGCRLMELP